MINFDHKLNELGHCTRRPVSQQYTRSDEALKTLNFCYKRVQNNINDNDDSNDEQRLYFVDNTLDSDKTEALNLKKACKSPQKKRSRTISNSNKKNSKWTENKNAKERNTDFCKAKFSENLV